MSSGIDKLPSGKWRVRYYVEGVRKPKTFTLKKDAEKFKRDIQRAIETGELDSSAAAQKTLAELAAEHMKIAKGELADRTIQVYRNLWSAHVDARILGREDRQWHHEIAETPLKLLTAGVVESWRQDRLKAGAGKASVRKTMALMKTMLDRAERDEIVRRNPVSLVKKPSGARTGEIKPVSPEQVERIRTRLDAESQVLVSVLAYSGVRPGEALALRWSDVGQTLRVQGGLGPDGTPKTTKTGPARNVVLLKPLAADLAAWRKRANGATYVFERHGRGWTEDDWRNWRKRKFAKAAESAGVPIQRAYDLRHSIASLWLHEGINPVQVAAWLGHNPSETYDTYAHVLAELDPKDKTSATKRIQDARRSLRVTDGSRNKRREATPTAQSKQKTARLQAVS